MVLRKWTEEEKQYLIDNYSKYPTKELAEHMGRSINSVRKFGSVHKLKAARAWKDDEVEYLEKYAGIKSYKEIGKKLGKSPDSIKLKVRQMNIGNCWENYPDYIHLSELCRLVGVDKTCITRTWVNRGLKTQKRSMFLYINIYDLFEFMKNHTDLWKPSKCECWFFENEKWFEEARKKENLEIRQKRWGEWYEVV